MNEAINIPTQLKALADFARKIIESEVNGRHNAMQIAQGLADSQGHGYVVVPGVGREDAFDEDAYMTAWDEEGVVVYPNDEGAW